jgi:hypothetical protein
MSIHYYFDGRWNNNKLVKKVRNLSTNVSQEPQLTSCIFPQYLIFYMSSRACWSLVKFASPYIRPSSRHPAQTNSEPEYPYFKYIQEEKHPTSPFTY